MSKFFLIIFLCWPNLTWASSSFKVQFKQIHKQLKFDKPLYLTSYPDERKTLIIVEQEGKIWKIKNNKKQIFLDITAKVNSWGNEEGLLGLAFSPNFKKNKYFYVYYSINKPKRTIVSKFKVTNQKVDLKSEIVIIEIPQPYSNHNGGMIAFGKDNYLYIGVGDGGSGGDPKGHGQNTKTLLGTILRIDPERDEPYLIPTKNPFAGKLGGHKKEIYCWGLRNPWRFSFDSLNGDLWVADVGQNKYEEINRIKAPGNLGWNAFEGKHQFRKNKLNKTLRPIHEYGRKLGESITGGYVYRGKKIKKLYGHYIYGDFVSGTIWALKPNSKLNQIEYNKKIGSIASLASFGADYENEIYGISLDGNIYQLIPR